MFNPLKQNTPSQRPLTLPSLQELKCATLSSCKAEALLELVGSAVAIKLLPCCTAGTETWRSHSHVIEIRGGPYLSRKHPAIFVENVEFLDSTPMLVGRALTAVDSFPVIIDSVLISGKVASSASAQASLRRSLLDSAKGAIRAESVFCYEEGRVVIAMSEVSGLVALPGAYLTTERELIGLFSELADVCWSLEERGAPLTAPRPSVASSVTRPAKEAAWRGVQAAGVIVAGALGLEYVNKAPWQDDSGAKPISKALGDLVHLRLPGAAQAPKAPSAPEPKQVAVEQASSEPEVLRRETLQKALEKAADIIRKAGPLSPPAIDLGSPEKTEKTLLAFAAAADDIPTTGRQKYALWGAIDMLVTDFREPDAVDTFAAAIAALSDGQPLKKPAEKAALPPSSKVPAQFRDQPHFVYLDRKETALPAIKDSLRPYDALLKGHGVASPENRLATAKDVMWTLTEYSNAIARVDPNHPAVQSLRLECTQLQKAPWETLESYERQFAGSKPAGEAYQKVRPELEPLLNTMLNNFSGGLRAQQEQVPSRDLSSLASATETLTNFQNAIGRSTQRNPDIDLLKEVIYGLKNDPKSLIDALKTYLQINIDSSK